jgi:hypothetical protein
MVITKEHIIADPRGAIEKLVAVYGAAELLDALQAVEEQQVEVAP